MDLYIDGDITHFDQLTLIDTIDTIANSFIISIVGKESIYKFGSTVQMNHNSVVYLKGVIEIIEFVQDSDNSYLLISGRQLGYLFRDTYSTKTIQFKKGTSLQNIIATLGYSSTGKLPLDIDDDILLNMGERLDIFCRDLALAHDRFLIFDDNGYIAISKHGERGDNEMDYFKSVVDIRSKQYDNITTFCDINYRIANKWGNNTANFGNGDYEYTIKSKHNRNKNQLMKYAKSIYNQFYRDEVIREFTVNKIQYKSNERLSVKGHTTYNIRSVKTIVTGDTMEQKLIVERLI